MQDLGEHHDSLIARFIARFLDWALVLLPILAGAALILYLLWF